MARDGEIISKAVFTALLAVTIETVAALPVLAQIEATTRPMQFEGKSCMTAGCHDTLAEPKYQHGPVAVGECQRCHEETDHVNHQYRLVAEPPALCFACHVELEEKLKNTAVRPHHHKPVDEGKCLDCHDPHASPQLRMLRGDSVVEFCMGCHQKTFSLTGHVHKPIEEKGCLECHRGHDSDAEKLLRVAREDLCFRCHEKKKQELRAARSVHKPFGERNCTGCHTPHASPQSKLLAKRFSADLYMPFSDQSYELCFSCHDRDLAVRPKTKKHTGFRNGETNLHYLHVNKASKGRSCRICHLPHVSDQLRLIRSKVPFREWELTIRYTPTTNGGYCGPACHPAKRYDRQAPLDWNQEPIAPDAHGPKPGSPGARVAPAIRDQQRRGDP